MTAQKKPSHTVLLAEDELFLSRTYKNKLELEGFTVYVAHDGEEVMTALKEHVPDILLLDLIMPKKNGFEVLEEKQNDESIAHIPVIVTSNLGQESDIEKAKKLGVQDYIIKSNISMKELVEKVRDCLGL